MRRWLGTFSLALLMIPGCGGGDGAVSTQTALPAGASAMDARLKSGMTRSLWMVANLESSLTFVLVPGTAITPGITVTPGPQPTVVAFSGTYDGNRDGFNESTLSGSANFASDPNIGWSSVTGQAVVDVAIPLLGHLYHGNLAFDMQSDQRRLSGTGTFTDPLTGDVSTMTVDPAAPLVVRVADPAAGIASNACGYNLSGRMRIDVSGAAGVLTSFWDFTPASTSVSVNGGSFKDSAGQTTVVPDANVDLRCGTGGSINDWAATFDQTWACLPRESGAARITIAVTGPDTVTITDEDPPGSGVSQAYQATVVASNPHSLSGFFIGGPVGNRYREDFNWTLGKNGGFAQVSRYAYIEGPSLGSGGICAASAKRVS